jgi:hypothetical protein
VLSASLADGKMAWYENVAVDSFSFQKVLNTEDGPKSIANADVDGDGWDDVIFSSLKSDKVGWYKNLGLGDFGEAITISNIPNEPRQVLPVDIDLDDDIDLVCNSIWTGNMYWY